MARAARARRGGRGHVRGEATDLILAATDILLGIVAFVALIGVLIFYVTWLLTRD